MIDNSVFPHPAYKDTVLAPLFDGVKTHFAHSMAEINRAHLVMLSDTGILTPSQVSSIAIALLEIESELDIDHCEYTGEFEDYFFLVENELKNKLGADLGGMLHTARSRNDMDHTVFKLQLRKHTDQFLLHGLELAETLLAKARAERDTPIVAYTHGQPAQPSTFGHYLGAALEVLLGDLNRVIDASRLLDYCPMGAAAITTSGFPIDRHRMAFLLGFAEPKRNSYGCIASVDYITGLYSSIKLVFLHIGRLVQDMAFWSAFEVGQLAVPNSLVQISSIMPQKRNPVPIEHLRHLSSVTIGRCDTIVNTMHNTPFTDMNDSEGEVQSSGFTVFDTGSRVLVLLSALVQSVSIDEERVQMNSDAACATITELADTLVRLENLSFRQAHEISAATAKAVLSLKKSLRNGYKEFSNAFSAQIGREPQLDEAGFVDAVSMQRFVAVRDRFGGPAPSALDEAFDHYAGQLEAMQSSKAASRERSTAAEVELEKAFSRLAEH